ncbi:DUF2258 domain-containing protein [Pyrodictium occultum]|uniref:DUF2258 domain-containing protein n=1 Tax=Pyrodictium occultum TaxID=2309 RepID=UPI0008A90276|nr:DUF2258 domain-containing protein [Pyrodictium occultum]
MPQLSTGLVIAGAYADKLRRVLFAQLRNDIKSGKIDSKQVARRAGELNRLLFEILVNKLHIDKGDAVRIRVEYEVRDGDIEWKLDTLQMEAFRRIPDEEVRKAVLEVIEKAEHVLARPETEEERAWTTTTEAEVERQIREAARRAARPAAQPPVQVSEAVVYGSTRSGEHLAILKDPAGENVGLAVMKEDDGRTRILVILVPGRKAYRAETTVDMPVSDLEKQPEKIVEAIRSMGFTEVSRGDAEKVIKEKMEEII